MIPQDLIDRIIDTAEIADVVGKFVKIKKKGASYSGLCPFHNEKTASFSVNPVLGIYKCFGCGKGGDSVGFLMEHEKLTFIEAVKELAIMYRITIPENTKPPTPEEIQFQQHKESIIAANEWAANFFTAALMDEKNKSALDYTTQRFSDESINTWRLGYADAGWQTLCDEALSFGFSEDILIEAGLCQKSTKGKMYDIFRGRIMFPITDKNGRVIGFTGRMFPEVENSPKYLNTTGTPVYSKGNTLYGLHMARRHLSTSATLVEGTTDVIRLHEIGVRSAIAPCGTSFGNDQLEIIGKYTDRITLIYDGDTAGLNAASKNGRMAILGGYSVNLVIMPEGEDPASYFTDLEKYEDYIANNKKDWILWRSDIALKEAGLDPLKKNEAIKEICGFLYPLDPTVRQLYLDQIREGKKISIKAFTDQLNSMDQETEKSSSNEILPTGVDPIEYERWGFYAYRNELWFRGKSGVEKLSNFNMRALFHIHGQDSHRVYELINYKGNKVVASLDMQEMTSIQAFRRNVEARGNFVFMGADGPFTRLKLKLYEETRSCTEVRQLGWQKEGFWAWANGISYEDKFEPIDEYGIIEFHEAFYFIPAFSKIYLDDKSIFLGERKFQYKERDISLSQYCNLFYDVFGDNSRVGVCFWIATTFRDFLLYINRNFPILNLFGPKGTGKSQMAMSLSCLYGEQQTPFNIHNGTKAGLAEHLQQFCNAFAWVDEYKNNLDYDKIETLKSVYDAIGRNRLNLERKKETTAVNAAMILSGQEMPTADVALFSRLIFVRFHQTEYSQDQKTKYDELKAMEKEGLSHLTAGLIKHRTHFEKKYYEYSQDVVEDIYEELKSESIEDRVLRSWAMLGAAFKCMESKMDFGFKYEDLRSILIKGIRTQNKQTARSSELGVFWDLVEALYNADEIELGWDFRLDFEKTLKVGDGNEIIFQEGKMVLKIKFTAISNIYAKEAKKIGGVPLPVDTLKYYLENSKQFIGICKAVKYRRKIYKMEDGKSKTHEQVTTAYCFDYDMLGIDLSRKEEDFIVPVVLPGDKQPEIEDKDPFEGKLLKR
jgi:DNA primase